MASHYKKMLDAIQAVLEGRITADVEAYQIAGRSITKISFTELREAENYYQAKVNQEEAKERATTGKSKKQKIKVKF